MASSKYTQPAPNAQTIPTIIEKPNNHLPLADGIYRVNNREYVGIIGLTEVCWGNYREVSRSYFEMQEAELSEVLL